MKFIIVTIIFSTFSFAQSSKENLIKFSNAEMLIGYKNKDSLIIVSPKYSNGSNFRNGLALVSIINQGWTIIDNKGNELIEKGGIPGTVYDDLDYEYIRHSIDNKWGFIDRNGILIIPYSYSENKDFNENLAPVKVGTKWGFINNKNEMIIKPIFEDANIFSDGIAAIKINNLWGFIDTNGKIIIEPKFIDVSRFSENLCAVSTQKNSWSFNQVIDKSGKVIFSGDFYYMELFKNGMSSYYEGSHFSGKHIFIDVTGKTIKEE